MREERGLTRLVVLGVTNKEVSPRNQILELTYRQFATVFVFGQFHADRP